MFVFDRKKIFDAYRARFGPLTQALVAALSFLFDKIEADQRIPTTDAGRWQLAYILATFKWETQHTFEPLAWRSSQPSRTPCSSVTKTLGARSCSSLARAASNESVTRMLALARIT